MMRRTSNASIVFYALFLTIICSFLLLNQNISFHNISLIKWFPRPVNQTGEEIATEFLAPAGPSDIVSSKVANAKDFESDWLREFVFISAEGKITRKGCANMKSFQPECVHFDILYHRKQWQIAYVAYIVGVHKLCKDTTLGVVWGTLGDTLVSHFVSMGCAITALNIHSNAPMQPEWSVLQQNPALKSNLFFPSFLGWDIFERRVFYQTTRIEENIPENRGKFNFAWSQGIIENSGSVLLGQKFILDSVQTLIPGGIAIHFLELSVTSRNETFLSGSSVIWTMRDIEVVAQSLEISGCEIFPINWGGGKEALDLNPDEPPFHARNQIKMRTVGGHIITSFALVIRKL